MISSYCIVLFRKVSFSDFLELVVEFDGDGRDICEEIEQGFKHLDCGKLGNNGLVVSFHIINFFKRNRGYVLLGNITCFYAVNTIQLLTVVLKNAFAYLLQITMGK